MKWPTRLIGTQRVVRLFAWLPTELGDGWTVWLTTYIAEQEWCVMVDGQGGQWKRWLTRSTRVKEPKP